MNVSKLVEIYDAVDEFLIKCMPYIEKNYYPALKENLTRTCWLTLSEIITIQLLNGSASYLNKPLGFS